MELVCVLALRSHLPLAHLRNARTPSYENDFFEDNKDEILDANHR
jgi:hypothetical protein